MIRIATCPECEKETAATDAPAADDDALVRCPHCTAEFPRGRLNLREVPELILVNAAAGAHAVAPQTHEGELELEEPEIVAPPPTDTPATEEPAESPIDMPVVAGAARQEFGGEISTEPRAARTNGGPSFLRQLVGIVGGGIVGLAIGYFILLWIGGPEKDFLEVGRRLPRWAVPGAFHADAEPLADERGEDEPSLADLLQEVPEEDLDEVPQGPAGLPPEPSVEDPLAAPEPVVERVAVRDPPELRTADLEAALTTASEVRLSLVAGELSDPAVRSMKTAAYQAFAALAEALTFAEATEGRESEHEQLVQDAEQLLRDALTTERMITQLGPLAADWLDSAARDNTGVVAAGLVVASHLGIEHQPGITVELAGAGRNVVVVGPAAIEVPVGSRVALAGALVDRPRERIEGYTGSAPQVVWAAWEEPVEE